MKTVKKQVHLDLQDFEFGRDGDIHFGRQPVIAKYTFFSRDVIENIESLDFYVEVEEPETIGEFICVHNISREDLIDWLNKNYKK